LKILAHMAIWLVQRHARIRSYMTKEVTQTHARRDTVSLLGVGLEHVGSRGRASGGFWRTRAGILAALVILPQVGGRYWHRLAGGRRLGYFVAGSGVIRCIGCLRGFGSPIGAMR
jgi:hypothetical protein